MDHQIEIQEIVFGYKTVSHMHDAHPTFLEIILTPSTLIFPIPLYTPTLINNTILYDTSGNCFWSYISILTSYLWFEVLLFHMIAITP